MNKKITMKIAAGLLCIPMAFALTACGESADIKQADEAEFEMQPLAGEAWDYSDEDNWMFIDNNDEIDHEVDVFYLYPTAVKLTVEEDVCDSVDDMRHDAHYSFIRSADTFSSYTNIYAPYYRQVSLNGIMKDPTEEGWTNKVKNSVTKTDVYAALDYYFENCNNGKPYILAGHSQGSCILKIVLSEYMKVHPEYLENMVACYAIGYYFPDSWFEENPQIKPAAGETDTGVLITWNTEGPGGTMYSLPLGNNDGFCINPLNWKTDETYADISLNKGSVIVDDELAKNVYNFVTSEEYEDFSEIADHEKLDGKKVTEAVRNLVSETTEGVADAQIDLERGALITTTYTNYSKLTALFGDKSCHFDDWNLYARNIQENAQKRIKAFLGHEGT